VETQPHVAKAVIDAPAGGTGMIDGLRQAVIGEDPFEVEKLWYKMYKTSVYYGRRGVAIQALSGIDNCLWSIVGQAVKQPIYKLLGAHRRNRIRAYASTLFRPSPEAMTEACRTYVDQGFTAVKFGWGVFGQDPRLDVELVRAAREALGPDRDLLIDPGWMVERTAEESIRMVKSIEPFRPFFVEDCLPPEDYDGYAKLARAVETPIAAGEQESTHWGFRQLIPRTRTAPRRWTTRSKGSTPGSTSPSRPKPSLTSSVRRPPHTRPWSRPALPPAASRPRTASGTREATPSTCRRGTSWVSGSPAATAI